MQHSHGGAAHGSVKEYVTGLIFSIVLTALPFAALMFDLFSAPITLIVILLCAIAQIFVQLIFFLHMNSSSEQLWNTTSAVFIVLIVAILVVGSIWIIEHLNHNMLMGH
nr:cytochrome o ubiquinol oxidase subunit IV [Pseudoalteromonas sp. NBT06-2]